MKIITLITGLAIFLANPVFAMIPDQEEQILPCNHPISQWDHPNLHNETSLECTRYSTGIAGAIKKDYEIVTLDEEKKEKIGEISVQYYPKSISYYKIPLNSVARKRKISIPPIVYLLHIEIKEQYQQHHETRAMEALIMDLRESIHFQQNTEIRLEYSSREPHLKEFYERFGFEEIKRTTASETNLMRVELNNAKLPYYDTQMEKK